MEVPNQDRFSLELDPSGCYVKIKVDFATSRIGLVIVGPDHLDEEIFWGKQAYEIYTALFSDCRIYRWISQLSHAAYIGKELKKAEIALALGSSYYQE